MKYSKRYIAFTIVLALVFILKFQILGVDNAQVDGSAEENWIHRYGIRWWQRKSTGRPFMP